MLLKIAGLFQSRGIPGWLTMPVSPLQMLTTLEAKVLLAMMALCVTETPPAGVRLSRAMPTELS